MTKSSNVDKLAEMFKSSKKEHCEFFGNPENRKFCRFLEDYSTCLNGPGVDDWFKNCESASHEWSVFDKNLKLINAICENVDEDCLRPGSPSGDLSTTPPLARIHSLIVTLLALL